MANYKCESCGFQISCNRLDSKLHSTCVCPVCGIVNALVEDESYGKTPYHVRIQLENERWFTVSSCENIRNACEIATVLLNANNVSMNRVLLEYLP